MMAPLRRRPRSRTTTATAPAPVVSPAVRSPPRRRRPAPEPGHSLVAPPTAFRLGRTREPAAADPMLMPATEMANTTTAEITVRAMGTDVHVIVVGGPP